MRNRFESYVHGQYTPQFVPTPFDTNFAIQALGAHQTYYDNLMKALDSSNQPFNYLKPNGFDMGDVEEATAFKNKRDQQIKQIAAEAATSTNLSELSRKIHSLANDPEYEKTKAKFEHRYAQDQQFRENLEKNYGKDPYYNHYQNWYNQNRYTKLDGENYSLNSPLAAQTPETDKLVKTWTDMIKANKFPIGNGQFLGTTGNGQYFISGQESVEQVTPERAQNIITNGLLGDPTVKNWLGVMNQTGRGKEAEDMLMSQIAAGTNASAYTKKDVDYKHYQNDLSNYATKKRMDEETPHQTNPWTTFNSQSIPPLSVNPNGQIKVNEELLKNDPAYKALSEKVNNSKMKLAVKEPSDKDIENHHKNVEEMAKYVKETYTKGLEEIEQKYPNLSPCLLYTSDAADE